MADNEAKPTGISEIRTYVDDKGRQVSKKVPIEVGVAQYVGHGEGRIAGPNGEQAVSFIFDIPAENAEEAFSLFAACGAARWQEMMDQQQAASSRIQVASAGSGVDLALRGGVQTAH